MIKLAIYDMDKTITKKATFVPFLAYAVPRYAAWRIVLAPLAALAALGFMVKLYDRGRLKAMVLGLMLGQRIDPVRLHTLVKGFAGRTLARNTRTAALDQIAADKADGYRIMIASASYAFYVHECAKLWGINNAVATGSLHDEQALLPGIAGENCYGAAKLDMIKAWLQAQNVTRDQIYVRFYSDHISDSIAMDWADEAFATAPHGPLRGLARQRQWPVLEWA
jgi:HAD superfamily phosphoserine phosphatase-like hydrolase